MCGLIDWHKYFWYIVSVCVLNDSTRTKSNKQTNK